VALTHMMTHIIHNPNLFIVYYQSKKISRNSTPFSQTVHHPSSFLCHFTVILPTSITFHHFCFFSLNSFVRETNHNQQQIFLFLLLLSQQTTTNNKLSCARLVDGGELVASPALYWALLWLGLFFSFLFSTPGSAFFVFRFH
jgi:hypothetical protein